MKRVVLVMASILLLASVGFSVVGCDNDDGTTVTWRLATYSMPDTLTTDICQKFADLVAEKSDGDMEVKIFTSGVIYTGTEIFDAVSAGAIDMGATPTSYYSTKCPKTSAIFAQMWSFDSNDVNEYIFIKKQLAEQVQVIQDEAEAANITHTLWINTGSAEFYFKKDVKTKADVAGLKMAGPPGGALGILQLLGASPVGMDNSEMYLSAQTGVIDGVGVVPLSDSYKLKFYEVLPYYVLTNTMMATFSTLMNSDSFAALTPKLQDVVTEAAAEAETWGLDAVAAGDADVIDTLENTSGVHVYTLPDAERQLWFDSALAPLFASMYSKMGVTADVVTEVQSIAADAKVDYAASK